MSAYALPIEIVLFQLLALLVAISVEAIVFYDRFVLTRRQSVEYSIILNLFSAIATWGLFFVVQKLLPETLRLELISLTFLGEFFRGVDIISVPSVLMLLGTINFLFICIVELSGSSLLQRLASIEPTKRPEASVSSSTGNESKKKAPPLMTVLALNDPDKAVTLLTANTFSNALIFLLFCILRFLA
ncbi:MAG: hypothetical protein SW833_07850 [Cyanobacteriota bacterium]|nr:hypothetical protein [Cyanobacteriota bacterium]